MRGAREISLPENSPIVSIMHIGIAKKCTHVPALDAGWRLQRAARRRLKSQHRYKYFLLDFVSRRAGSTFDYLVAECN